MTTMTLCASSGFDIVWFHSKAQPREQHSAPSRLLRHEVGVLAHLNSVFFSFPSHGKVRGHDLRAANMTILSLDSR